MNRTVLYILVALAAQPFIWAAEKTFYKNPNGLFSTRPGETKSLQNIKRFGPVGMGIDLLQPAFTMRISHIEESSPAAATGQLKAGQIIETINGQKLADIDPRIQLGQILAAAEATDGLLKFAIKERGRAGHGEGAGAGGLQQDMAAKLSEVRQNCTAGCRLPIRPLRQ